jgi:hypothetical protein
VLKGDQQGKNVTFHPLIEAGALTHIWLGEARPSKFSLANFVIKTFRQTQNDQIAFSPEFTTCNLCHRTSRGLRPSCVYCGSEDVDGITRITGYFSKVSGWNKGKIAELQSVNYVNLHELAKSMRTVLLPGEVISLRIVREGKDRGQGVGYLPDGTMVVVNNAQPLVGQTVDAQVQSTLQTGAGASRSPK